MPASRSQRPTKRSRDLDRSGRHRASKDEDSHLAQDRIKPDFLTGLHCEQPLNSVLTTLRPEPLQLHDLEAVRMLGEGSFGKVLLVRVREKYHKHRHDRPGTLYAIKTLAKKVIRNYEKEDIDQKHMERRSLCSLPWNPFINGLVATFYDSKNLYLLLEYMPYGSLADLIHSRTPTRAPPITTTSAAFYFANIVCGLVFLHSFDLVHRDLKPDNILIGHDGYLCIADFGYATVDTYSGAWNGLGTTVYMAPELIVPQGLQGSPVDWWAAGCILFEMLTREAPFQGHDMGGIWRKIMEGNINWPPPDLIPMDQPLVDIIKRLLTIKCDERLGSYGVQDVREHQWLKNVVWEMMERRRYNAPYVPPEANHVDTWHAKPFPPKKRKIPGLAVADTLTILRHDNRCRAVQRAKAKDTRSYSIKAFPEPKDS